MAAERRVAADRHRLHQLVVGGLEGARYGARRVHALQRRARVRLAAGDAVLEKKDLVAALEQREHRLQHADVGLGAGDEQLSASDLEDRRGDLGLAAAVEGAFDVTQAVDRPGLSHASVSQPFSSGSSKVASVGSSRQRATTRSFSQRTATGSGRSRPATLRKKSRLGVDEDDGGVAEARDADGSPAPRPRPVARSRASPPPLCSLRRPSFYATRRRPCRPTLSARAGLTRTRPGTRGASGRER